MCVFRFVCAIFSYNNWYQSPGLGWVVFHTNLGFLEVNDFVAEIGLEKDSHKIEKFDGTNFSFWKM